LANFDKAFLFLMRNEDASLSGRITVDTGGKTRYGISQHAYPNEDIDNLTLDRAKFLCKHDYWDKCSLDALNGQDVANKILDMVFNMGEGTPGRMVQVLAVLLGAQIAVDGNIGPGTIAEINEVLKIPQADTCILFGLRLLQLYHYAELLHKDPKTYTQFWKGYVARAKE
jgi:lysozyme family protein